MPLNSHPAIIRHRHATCMTHDVCNLKFRLPFECLNVIVAISRLCSRAWNQRLRLGRGSTRSVAHHLHVRAPPSTHPHHHCPPPRYDAMWPARLYKPTNAAAAAALPCPSHLLSSSFLSGLCMKSTPRQEARTDQGKRQPMVRSMVRSMVHLPPPTDSSRPPQNRHRSPCFLLPL
jgi:hypothetical protein